MRIPSRSLNARLLKAKLAMQDGRISDGVEELREAVLDAYRLTPRAGRKQVEEILNFAKENDAFEEVQEIFETDNVREHFFGSE